MTQSARPDTERESFVRLVDAGHKAEQNPSAGELIELRERLGEDHGVATERHDVGAQLEPLRRGRRVAEPDDRVDARPHRDVGQPQGVEVECLELLDEFNEARRVESEATRRDSETNLHINDLRGGVRYTIR